MPPPMTEARDEPLPEPAAPEPHRDPVTGAATEPSLLRFIEAVLAMAEPAGPQVGLLCLEIDGLDRLPGQGGDSPSGDSLCGESQGDDSLGKLVREAVLLGVADRLHEQVRGQDLVGRLDQGFGICLADIFPAQAQGAAERLLRVIRNLPVPTPVGAVPLTCSIGLALSRGAGEDTAALVERARALREAARRGGGDAVVTAI